MTKTQSNYIDKTKEHIEQVFGYAKYTCEQLLLNEFDTTFNYSAWYAPATGGGMELKIGFAGMHEDEGVLELDYAVNYFTGNLADRVNYCDLWESAFRTLWEAEQMKYYYEQDLKHYLASVHIDNQDKV